MSDPDIAHWCASPDAPSSRWFSSSAALSACSEETEYPPALPESSAEPPAAAQGAEASFAAELYFVSEDGRKLYQLAREGKPSVEVKREATIYALDLVSESRPNRFLIRVCCSKGTYIRSAVISTTMGPGIPVDPSRVSSTVASAE